MKILLPVDGSPNALAAVAHALRLVAAGLSADFVLINVQEPANLYELVVAHDADVIEQVRGAAGADLLQPAEAMLSDAGQRWESEVAGGDPAHMLLELVERYGCQAVVMGATGGPDAGSASSSHVGAVALALLQRCAVPVTVVRLSAMATGEAGEAGEKAEAEADDSGSGSGA